MSKLSAFTMLISECCKIMLYDSDLPDCINYFFFVFQEPFLVIEDVVGTYELSSCYNVTIDCRAADMVATVRTNKIFNGKIYAKDNPNR